MKVKVDLERLVCDIFQYRGTTDVDRQIHITINRVLYDALKKQGLEFDFRTSKISKRKQTRKTDESSSSVFAKIINQYAVSSKAHSDEINEVVNRIADIYSMRFIDKAEKFVRQKFSEAGPHPLYEGDARSNEELIEEFKEFVKGEE